MRPRLDRPSTAHTPPSSRPPAGRDAAPHARDGIGGIEGRLEDRLEDRNLQDRILVVSNRGPVEHQCAPDGRPVARRGSGGVVSGLLCALGTRAATWISLAMTDGDRELARRYGPAARGDGALDLRLVDVPAAAYRRHYEGISNRVLWFAQHYLLSPGSGRLYSKRTLRDWRDGYSVVNEAVARAVLAELRARPNSPVLFQDYHLYLAPAHVRAERPDARLAQFVHVPWPEARYWELLPEEMVGAIFRGLASNDVIGFQTERDARNFLDGAPRFLGGARALPGTSAGSEPGVLRWNGRHVLVRAYPIAVCTDEVQAGAESPEARRRYEELRDELGLDDLHRLILRVDRVEPTKNIVRGFQAFERLLREHPEHHGRVTFLALLVPSRQNMAEYRRYERQVRAAIARVNERFGRPGWQPIVAIFGNDRARALACMRRYDVLLVNPLIDGMNLVVKEGPLVNQHNGVVVLSRGAGAYEQLRDSVLDVSPVDVAATADALHAALTMPLEVRAAHAAALRRFLRGDDARAWLDAQLTDLARLRALPRPASAAAIGRAVADRVLPFRPVAAQRALATDDYCPIASSHEDEVLALT